LPPELANALREKFLAVGQEHALDDFHRRAGNVLVIAPHPDDDVLGAGGTMAVYSEARKAVFSLYVTDGRGSPGRDEIISDEEFVLRRRRESVLALEKIGAAGAFFLGHRSEDLAGEGGRGAEGEVRDIARFLQPEEIFLPAPYERHRTHQRCTKISVAALRSAAPCALLRGYSLWGCFSGGKKRVFSDISSAIRKKVDAVIAHESQIAYKSYHQGILGKNNYDAVFWETHETQGAAFAEIFVDMTELLTNPDLTLAEFVSRDFACFRKTFLLDV
jgi:N-acetylglucosamine malate deacetylase 1